MTNTSAVEKDARRIQRIALTLPSRVEYKISKADAWNEITRLADVSAFGAGFNLTRPVKRGRLVQLTIPMPRQLRCFDFLEPQYRIWSLVRHCVPIRKAGAKADIFVIGAAFIGKHAPVGYLDNPARLYEISHREEDGFWKITEATPSPDEKDLPKEWRKHSRLPIPANIMIEQMDEAGNITRGELSVTENISLSGASVFSTLQAEIGSFIRVSSDQYNVSIIAIVRGKRMGTDGIPRLHLEFVDRYFPLEGIE
jgi:PilZ domain